MNSEELYLANESLVYYAIKKTCPEKLFDEDVQQLGRLALWKACVSYDKDASKFSTYACNCIKNELIMHIRTMNTQKRIPKNAFLVSLDQRAFKSDELDETMLLEVIPGDNDVTFMDLEGFWKSLSFIERDIIRCKFRGMTRPEIATKLGISHTTVWRHTVSIRKKWDMYI